MDLFGINNTSSSADNTGSQGGDTDGSNARYKLHLRHFGGQSLRQDPSQKNLSQGNLSHFNVTSNGKHFHRNAKKFGSRMKNQNRRVGGSDITNVEMRSLMSRPNRYESNGEKRGASFGQSSYNKINDQPSNRMKHNQFGNKSKETNFNKSKKSFVKFGYKKLKELTEMKDGDECIVYICQNLDFFSSLLDENPRADLLKLLMEVLVKIIDSKFSDSKLQVYLVVCNINFMKYLMSYVGTEIMSERDVTKINTHLIFFNNIHMIFKDIMKLLPSNAVETLNDCIIFLLNAVRGMELSQMVPLFEELRCQLDDETKRFNQEHIEKKQRKYFMDEGAPPNDFREVSLYPTIEDFIIKPFVRRNIIDGKYHDVYHYLDVQFRLLREDFIDPLRSGISQYRESQLEGKFKRNFNIKIYKNVKFLSCAFDEKHMGELQYKVQLDSKFASKIKWKYSKRLLFGSLCLFSEDNFETFVLATISNRDEEKLNSGFIYVNLVGEVKDTDLLSKTYTMAESSAFFEPVYQVLKAIQSLDVDNLAMERYLLVHDITPSTPEYLLGRSVTINNISVSINVNSTWPTCETLGLNKSQYEAMKASLRNEFVVIQGPPGTGKTFLGTKIVKTLVKNDLSHSPILMVCYTNHALDQFLENMLSFTTSIVRVGGRCNNELINEYNLGKVRRKVSLQRSQAVNQIKDDMAEMLQAISSINKFMKAVQKGEGIINLFNYNKTMKLKGLTVFDTMTDYLSWLLDDKYDSLVYILNKYVDGDLEKSNVSAYQREEQETQDFENENDDMDDEGLKRRQMLDEDEDEELIKLFEDVKGVVDYCLTIARLKRLFQFLEKQVFYLNSLPAENFEINTVLSDVMLVKDLIDIMHQFLKMGVKPSFNPHKLLSENLWSLNNKERWTLYHYWLNMLVKEKSLNLIKMQTNYSNSLNMWKESKIIEDYTAIKQLNPKIIGLTTTGAAKHQKLLAALKPQVIVVEEAAEVLEAHIIVSLNASCKHLILIGDHKQLKPNPSTYRLAKEYNLEVSLFERMLKNGVGCYSLNVQHRMKPNIAALVTPSIYEDLQNHQSVSEYPPVTGVTKNLYFVSHSHQEEMDDDMQSHKNEHEAEFMVALCRHLILQGYKPSDVVILTTYSSQQIYLRDLKKRTPLLKDVRMTTVDNYQGEESTIVLLSLVRSNKEEKIGFLAEENRLCVALSRAKHGLYIIGNMDLLKSKSEIWNKVNTTLMNDEAIGESLELVCVIHGTVSHVKCAYDFKKVSEGGCSLLCGREMPCGHNCQSLCHVVDIEHKEIQCYQPCERGICEENHNCPLKCYEKCLPCQVQMDRILPECGHNARMSCHTDVKEFKCQVVLKDVKLDCKHEVDRFCSQHIDKVICLTPCAVRLDCGHACTLMCHVNKDPDHEKFKCIKDCAKKNLKCSLNHNCQKRCWEQCGDCMVKVKQNLDCGHYHTLNCSTDLTTFKCRRDCKRELVCGHKCKKKCFEKCGDCVEKVEKIIPECGHTIEIECKRIPSRSLCRNACERKLKCGHPCKLKCSMECSSKKCVEIVPAPVRPDCGHRGSVLCYKSGESINGSDDNILKYCKEPCGKTLSCNDVCKGTCGSCMQGRIHQVCTEKCSNILICGHACTEPCRDACPPCKEKCRYKCAHSYCNKQCGVPCKPCKEKCEWSCVHFKCTKLCGQMCDRPPCYEPCTGILKCNHPCAGFCGEPCPSLCKVCSSDKIREIFFGTEDEEDARFVELTDCNHVFESTGLEQWLHMNEEKDSEISVKGCPKCKTPITRTLRFSNVVKRTFELVHKVKKKIYGNRQHLISMKEHIITFDLPNLKLLVKQAPDFVRLDRNLTYIIASIVSINKKRGLGGNNLSLYQFICVFLRDLLQSCIKMKKTVNSEHELIIDLETRLVKRFDLLLFHLSQRKEKISEVEIDQFNLELNRFKRIVEFLNVLLEKNDMLNLSTLCNLARSVLQRFFSIQPYTNDHEMVLRIEEVAKYTGVFYSPVSKAEMSMVHSAMKSNFQSGNKQGHWFSCSNGHIYAITECGGAMEKARCPECKEVIGGSQHALVSTSRLATEMDGATHPAWSEQQNMMNFQFL